MQNSKRYCCCSRHKGAELAPNDKPALFLRRFCLAVCTIFGLALLAVPASADDASQSRKFSEGLLPLLRTYCFDCHGNGTAEGDFDLDAFKNPDSILKHRKIWMRALGQVQLGSMPPVDGPSLDPETRRRLVQLIDDMANAVDCVKNPNAGKVVLRRLNRFEYRNTIRDLLGVDYEPANNFPGDDVGYGFDNIGDVLSLPPLLMEKYLFAADDIVQRAIATPPAAEVFEMTRSGGQFETEGGAATRGNLTTLFSNGKAKLEINFPLAGQYELVLTARGDQAGNEPPTMEVSIGGKSVAKLAVAAEEATEYQCSFRTPAGKRHLEIAFTNDFYDKEQKADRNLYLLHMDLRGESRRRTYLHNSEITDSHKKIIFIEPSDRVTPDQATREVLQRLTSRAYRRPSTAREVDRLCKLAADVRSEGGTFEESIQVALQAILVSPHFLFKVERTQPKQPNGQSLPLTDFELATRLSYMMWSSMPDDALLKSAWEGNLSKRKVLRAHIARMIKDRRSNAFIENFAGQWLQLRSLDVVRPDETKFPTATPAMRELMKRETLTFVAGIMRENRPVTELLDADFTYLNEPLAKYYGISGVEGNHFRPVSLKGTDRGGLLTQASILTVTSNPTRTSPVKRGKWILENLLNTPPPSPPPDIPELEKDALAGTLRQQMEQHRANPACATCHNMMDPLGFAMENFDAAGRWRTHDGGAPIDASGELPDGTSFQGVKELRELLAVQRSEQFVQCVAEKMMTYALGRGLEYYDKCAVDKIVADVETQDYGFAYLIAAIVESHPFQSQGTR